MNREMLILFTRFPLAGRAKTRLVPHVGAERAAALQREMTEHVLARVWPFVKRRNVKLEVRFEDGSRADMRRWFGRAFIFVPQGQGDLGARMLRATNEAFGTGMDAMVVIGADCPELDAALVERTFDLLRTHPVVFGFASHAEAGRCGRANGNLERGCAHFRSPLATARIPAHYAHQ